MTNGPIFNRHHPFFAGGALCKHGFVRGCEAVASLKRNCICPPMPDILKLQITGSKLMNYLHFW